MKRNLARARRLMFRLALATTGAGGAGLLGCSADDGRPSGPIIVVAPRDAASGSATSDAAVDSGKKPLAADCTENVDCESATCFKGTRSSYCTLICTPDNAIEVCAGVFGGSCNQQGFCRRPN